MGDVLSVGEAPTIILTLGSHHFAMQILAFNQQCAKCRKAYYCSSKCFNEHLHVHNNFCAALPLVCAPKGTKLDLRRLENPETVQAFSKKAATASSFNEKIDGPHVDKTDSMLHKSSSFHEKEDKKQAKLHNQAAKQEDEPTPEMNAVENCLHEVYEVLDVSDGDDSLGSIQEMMSKSFSSLRGPSSVEEGMSKSFSSFGRPFAYTSNEAEFTKEEIELRHAELVQREFCWKIPDWVNSPLKSTHQGKILRAEGNLASPVTDVQLLLERSEIGWQKPEWTNAKLRPTPQGEHLKKERKLAEAPSL